MGCPTVTPDDDPAAVESDSCVDTRPQGDITPLAGVAFELAGKATPASLGDPASQTNILPRAVELAGCGLLFGEFEEDLDALFGDTHCPTWGSVVC